MGNKTGYKNKNHLGCITATEALVALIHSDGISYRAKPAYNCPYAEPEQQSTHMRNAPRLEQAGLYLPAANQQGDNP